MTRVEWLLNKVPEPIGSDDFYGFYDAYCEDRGPVDSGTFKRYCRTAMEVYRGDVEETVVVESSLKDRDVILDSLNETENKLEISLKSFKIQDVEVAAKIAGIDLTKWKCVRKRVRASQNKKNPWFIVEGSFALKDQKEITPEDMLENFKTILKKHTPPTSVIEPPEFRSCNNMALFSFYDHHIGKLVNGDITGNNREWTTTLAKQSMLDATDYFIEQVKGKVETVWFMMGNDLLNVDNPEETTAKGTPQKNDIEYKHLILESEDLVITILEKLLHHFPVEVIVVPGNHDKNLIFLLGEIIRRYFHNNSNITVDNSLSPIKYRQFGENAIGFIHGDEQIKKKYVLPMLMMQQRPDLAKCYIKEFHTGHIHQTKRTQMTEIAEDYGVTMRTFPTLSPTCNWASGKGYQGIQASECIVYNRDSGPIATFRYLE